MSIKKKSELFIGGLVGLGAIGALAFSPQSEFKHKSYSTPTLILDDKPLKDKDSELKNSPSFLKELELGSNSDNLKLTSIDQTKSAKPCIVIHKGSGNETWDEYKNRVKDNCTNIQIVTNDEISKKSIKYNLDEIIFKLNQDNSKGKKTKIAIESLKEIQCGNESCLTQYKRLMDEKEVDVLKGISLFMAETWDYKTGKVNPFAISYTMAVGPQIQVSNIQKSCPYISPSEIQKLVIEENKSREARKGLKKNQLQNYINARTLELEKNYTEFVKNNISDINKCAVGFLAGVIERTEGEESLEKITSKWYSEASNGVNPNTSKRALELIALSTEFQTGLYEANQTLSSIKFTEKLQKYSKKNLEPNKLPSKSLVYETSNVSSNVKPTFINSNPNFFVDLNALEIKYTKPDYFLDPKCSNVSEDEYNKVINYVVSKGIDLKTSHPGLSNYYSNCLGGNFDELIITNREKMRGSNT